MTMEANTVDKKTMELNDAYKKIIHLTYKLQQVKILAFLLYLKQHHSLILVSDKGKVSDNILIGSYKDISLYCNKKIEPFTNNVFDELQYSIIYEIHESGADQYAIEIATILNELVLDASDSLLILDKVNAGLGYKGIFYPPHELSLIISSFINDDTLRIYDPFGGNMDFATTMTTNRRHFVANEIDRDTRDIALFRLAIAGILNQTKLSYNPSGEWTDEIFDAVITLPPFGLKIKTDGLDGLKYLDNAEKVAFQHFKKSTNDTGLLITAVPMSFLNRNDTKELRETITKNNWLDFIICLPQRLFQTISIFSAIIVLRKHRADGEPIHFFDASNYDINDNLHNVVNKDVIKRSYSKNHLEITREEILAYDSSWNVQWYLDRRNQIFNDGYTVVECKDILETVELDKRFADITGRIANISSLASDYFQYEKDVESFPESDNLTGTSKVTEPVVLISLIGKPKPTYCQASQQKPLFIKPDVSAFRLINNTVHPGYLCMELSKRLTADVGSVIPRLSKTQILRTGIGFPSLNETRSWIEQKNMFDEAQKAEQMTIIREKGLEKIIETLKDDHLKNIHARKHAMMQNTSTLALAWDNLLYYLENNHGPFDMNDVIGRKHPVKIEDLVRSITQNIKTIDKQAKYLTDIEQYWGEVDNFYIQDFISEYIKEHQSTLFRYEFEDLLSVKIGFYNSDGDYMVGDTDPTWKVQIPQNALRQVIDNIVSNALSHGFTQQLKDYCIRFEYYYDLDNIVLEVSNNGEPLHEKVDTEYIKTYGNSTKLNEQSDTDGKVHSGIGGNEIKSILEKYGAEFEVISSPDSEYTVSYKITFHNILQTQIKSEQDE